jgi:enterochelin esterase family protein
MIIVMPNGSIPWPANLPRFRPGSPPSPELRAAFEAAQNRFTDELLKEVIPVVERRYRVKPGAENRALAGLSMGGGQTLRVLTGHPDHFGYYAIWSAGLFGSDPAEWARNNSAFLSDADKHNGSITLLAITVGDEDFALEGSRALAKALDTHGVKHEMEITGGGHTWINWRRYLNTLLPRLFH